MKRRGFTLVELLAVIAVIVILAGLLFPVFVQAKLDSRRATTLSNLRQCGMALIMYSDDYGGAGDFPDLVAASTALAQAPTCDPVDKWRTTCTEAFGAPLVGSYAYVRGVTYFADQATWQNAVEQQSNPTLMLFLGFTSPTIPAFHGEAPPTNACDGGPCFMPRKMLRVHLDGSVSPRITTNGRLLFSWAAAFNDDAETKVKVS